MKRLCYIEDGSSLWSVVTSFAAGNQTAISAANQAIINGDATQAAQYLALITSVNLFSGVIIKFAKACNIEKIFLSFYYNTVTGTPATTLLVEASADSTDGNDGTWTTIFTESHTIRAAASESRLFLNIQTSDEESQTYTYLRVSWSGNANLNNLRLQSFWVYADYSSPPYDFYDAQGVTKVKIGEILFGTFSGDAVVAKVFRFKIKNNDSANRTYTLTFAKIKSVADATFAAHITLSNDGSTKAVSATVTGVAPDDFGNFYVHVDIPAVGSANANPQDAAVHYGKITVAATGVTVLPGLIVALYYDTLINIELLRGIGLTNICLVYQRDVTDEGEIAAWAWWDVYGVASCVQQETVGNDIVLVLDSSSYVWEMDRNEFDNEEFNPAPVQMVVKTVETPAKADPHIWRRNCWFDFDVEGADGGMIADYILTAHRDTGDNTTTQQLQINNPGMRVAVVDVGFQFNHELRIYTGGKLAIKNYGAYYQDISIKGRLPYVAGV